MSRTFFAAILLVLSAANGAFAQSISVFSHTTIFANGQAMAECGTIMNDPSTVALYASVNAWCGVFLNSNSASFNDFHCQAGKPVSRCSNIYSTEPGQTYATITTHGINPYLCAVGLYSDPLDYGIRYPLPFPSFGETGVRIGSPATGGCVNIVNGGSNLGIAVTTSNSKTTTSTSPSQMTLYETQSQQFTANKNVTWSLQGNGQLVGGLYKVPEHISDGESAVVQACDSQNSVDCAEATITLKNATVTVTPDGEETLPIPGNEKYKITFKATILPNILTSTLGHFKWSQTPTGIGHVDEASGVYTPPTNGDLTRSVRITVQACSTDLTSLCGTATFEVPKVDITVVPLPPHAFLAVPENSFTIGANVLGPHTSPEVSFQVSPGTPTPQGFNTMLYTPPAKAITTRDIAIFTVCLQDDPAICVNPKPTMVLVPPITIMSPGVWNAGTTNQVKIAGTGFGAAPEVRLSDPNIIFSYAQQADTAITLTATVPVSSGGQPLTITVLSSTEGVTPPPASVTVTPTKASLTITPTTAQLREGQTQTFTTMCTAAGGPCTAPSSPNWFATLGAISPPEATITNYTAPSVNGTAASPIQVRACWSVVPQQCATALVTVNPLTVAVTPTSANVNGCSTKQFNVQVTNASVPTVTWKVVPPVGNIDPNGFYTSPCPVTTQTPVQILACSTANTQRCGTSNVTLMPVSVTVSPQTASVQPSGTQAFSAIVLNTTNLGVTWSLTPSVPAAGSIDANGLYRAPSAITVASVTVTATSKADNVTKGTAQVLLVNPNAGLSPATLTFAAQDVGTTSAAQTVTLSNPGTAAFSLSITTTGEFTQTNNCGASLVPGGTCTINVQFTPTGMGVRTGTLRVTDTAPGSPHIASLNGTGRGPGASLNPTSLDFGGQRAGFTTAARMATFANTGTGPMSISGISVEGDYIQSNNCGASLAAGTSCAISVSFSPAAGSLGLRPGTLRVNDNSPGSPQTASLTGTAFGGFHDSTSCSSSSGWAWDPTQPNMPINVYIFEGDNLLATVLANQYRSDLAGLGIGNGFHGFNWPTPPSLRDGLTHTVAIRFSQDFNAAIPGSPKSVTCAPTAGILWIQPAESTWGPAGTLTAAGYATNGTGRVQLVWRERSSAGVWGGWTTVAYQALPDEVNTDWSNTISSGNPTNKCHWFEAYASYSGVTSAVFRYTGAPGCP